MKRSLPGQIDEARKEIENWPTWMSDARHFAITALDQAAAAHAMRCADQEHDLVRTLQRAADAADAGMLDSPQVPPLLREAAAALVDAKADLDAATFIIGTVQADYRALSARLGKREASPAMASVIDERTRQVEGERWDAVHDDSHAPGELAAAGAAYALVAFASHKYRPHWWPWTAQWWKPQDSRRDLVRAGALIVAEIERLDRVGSM